MPELFHYQAQVRIGERRRVWTAIHACNDDDARELLEAIFGKGSVVGIPRKADDID